MTKTWDRSKAPPLQSLALSARPLTSHALAWSCDAELAVATTDGVYIFLPEYPPSSSTAAAVSIEQQQQHHRYYASATTTTTTTTTTATAAALSSSSQFPLFLQTAASLRPDPLMNAPLCRFAGVEEQFSGPGGAARDTDDGDDDGDDDGGGGDGDGDDDDGAPPLAHKGFSGVGSGLVTGAGAALGHVVRVEWSPSGLGCNLRPVLTVLTTHGAVVCFGEHIHLRGGGGGGDDDSYSSTNAQQQHRSFKNWKTLWGLGAQLPLPVAAAAAAGDGQHPAHVKRMDERITSLSWAQQLVMMPGRALLAYATDEHVVVIMSVQFYARDCAPHDMGWEIEELARFNGRGAHIELDTLDPDFSSSGSAFSIKWSPWVTHNGKQTATLSYIAHNYVGFRRVTLEQPWKRGEKPSITVESHDMKSICLWLSTDAFLEWENTAWEDDDGTFYMRGIIASPFTVHPFQIPLTGSLSAPVPHHETSICCTTYPKEKSLLTNPISGLVVHHVDASQRSLVPRYSLVRQSCTATNQDWFQTTLPEDETPMPQWAEDLGQRSIRRIRRERARCGKDIDSDDSEDDDAEAEAADVAVHGGGGGDDDDDDGGAGAAVVEAVAEMRESDANDEQRLVHPRRFRLWGLAASPGDGCTAAVVSKYSTQHPSRRDRAEIVFGWRDEAVADGGKKMTTTTTTTQLTTEARIWEWMYGGSSGDHATDTTHAVRPVRRRRRRGGGFRRVLSRIRCVFCEERMEEGGGGDGSEAVCSNGHCFATCSASGIPIMAPGISRVCAVCGLRCIKSTELEKLVKQYLDGGEDEDGGEEEHVSSEATADSCGGCGGKFII